MSDTQPQRFHLERTVDLTGVSGTGRVADGILWPDGTATLRWRGPRPSTVHWDHLDDAEHVHGHGGATTIVWDDPEPPDPAADPATAELTHARTVLKRALLRERTGVDACAEVLLDYHEDTLHRVLAHQLAEQQRDRLRSEGHDLACICGSCPGCLTTKCINLIDPEVQS